VFIKSPANVNVNGREQVIIGSGLFSNNEMESQKFDHVCFD